MLYFLEIVGLIASSTDGTGCMRKKGRLAIALWSCNGNCLDVLLVTCVGKADLGFKSALLPPPTRQRLCDRSFCLSVCHSVSRITEKVMSRFH